VSLRLRLTIVLISALTISTTTFALLLVRSTRASLLKQVGNQLVAIEAHDAGSLPGVPSELLPASAQSDVPATKYLPSDPKPLGDVRRIARFLFNTEGRLLDSQDSGSPNNPDPVVSLPPIGSMTQRNMTDQIVIRRSVDGSIRYLVLTRKVSNGIRFDAAPLTDIDQLVKRLTLIAVFGGGAMALGASILTTLLINRTLQPVNRMVATAERIAFGDLSARVPKAESKTELGRLGASLNSMLNTIEEALKERDGKEDELRRFLADASHELRTPITIVQGYTDLYTSGALTGPGELDRAMQRIDGQVQGMSRLVQDLLLLANLDQSDFIERVETNLTELANESVSEFLMVSCDHPAMVATVGDVIISVDARRIRQVFDNLLQNVRAHTPVGTSVTISVARSFGTATVVVHDSGPGIACDDLPFVFQRFWRGDRTRGRSVGSAGLGLAITESIVGAHGGSIEVVSNRSDGTTFTINMPSHGTGASLCAVTATVDLSAQTPG
jgi:signal transduction histidine kinase